MNASHTESAVLKVALVRRCDSPSHPVICRGRSGMAQGPVRLVGFGQGSRPGDRRAAATCPPVATITVSTRSVPRLKRTTAVHGCFWPPAAMQHTSPSDLPGCIRAGAQPAQVKDRGRAEAAIGIPEADGDVRVGPADVPAGDGADTAKAE